MKIYLWQPPPFRLQHCLQSRAILCSVTLSDLNGAVEDSERSQSKLSAVRRAVNDSYQESYSLSNFRRWETSNRHIHFNGDIQDFRSIKINAWALIRQVAQLQL